MLTRRLALAIAVIAGVIGSQGPEFAQQYRQRIGGALDELKRIVAEFDAETSRERMTPAQGVQRLEGSPDPLARERGEDMAQTINRARRLEEQLEAMSSAGPLRRLYVMIKDSTLRSRGERSIISSPPRRSRSRPRPPPVSPPPGDGRRRISAPGRFAAARPFAQTRAPLKSHGPALPSTASTGPLARQRSSAVNLWILLQAASSCWSEVA